MHQLSPAAKGRAIEAEDVEGVAHLIQPGFDFGGFGGVLLAGALDPGLDSATLWSQARTAPWGRGLRSSDTTLVPDQEQRYDDGI